MEEQSQSLKLFGVWRWLTPRGPMILLLAAVAIFFWKVFTFQGALFFFDLIEYNVPVRDFFFKHVAHGHFPLWSPELCSGFPLFGEGQMGPLYLPNYFLFTWLPGWVALNLSTVLHSLVGALGAYYYFKRSHTAGAAAIGAMTYVLGAPLVFHLIHFSFFEKFCLFPWLFVFVDRFLERGRIVDVLAAALTLGAMVATGHQQGAVYAAMALIVCCATWSAEALASRRPRIAAEVFSAGLAIGLLAFAMSAVAIQSTHRLLDASVRGNGVESSFLFSCSTSPEALPRLASPAQHGRRADNTWSATFVPEKEVAVYLGLATWCFLPLIFAGPLSRRDRAHLAVAAFALLFILGAAGPFAELVKRAPLLNRMRIPSRFMMAASLSFAFLTASGLDNLRRESVGRRPLLICLAGGAAAWAATAWGGAAAAYGKVIFHSLRGASPVVFTLRHDLTIRSFLAAGLIAESLVALWIGRKKLPVGRGAILAIAVLVFADLSSAGRDENPVANPSIYDPRATVRFLRQHLDGYRFYSTEGQNSCGRAGWRQDISQYRGTTDGLPFATPALFGVRAASCDSPLIFARYDRVLKSLSLRWLRQLSVKYLLNIGRFGGLRLVRAAKVGRIDVFEIPRPAPIYSLASQAIPVADAEDAFAAVGDAEDVNTAFIEISGQPLDFEPPTGWVQAKIEEPDFRRLSVATDRPAFLIVRENYDPGWRAAVDGVPAPTWRTNYLFYGFEVPAGRHEATLTYRPSGFRPTLAVSLVTAGAVLGLALFFAPFRRERPALLKVVAAPRAARWTSVAILILFIGLLALAIALHPKLWDFTHWLYPRGW